jgi:hypothetical protein
MGGEDFAEQIGELGILHSGRIPERPVIGVIAPDEIFDEAQEIERIARLVLVGAEKDAALLHQPGEQAAAGMRFVEENDGSGQACEFGADGL